MFELIITANQFFKHNETFIFFKLQKTSQKASNQFVTVIYLAIFTII